MKTLTATIICAGVCGIPLASPAVAQDNTAATAAKVDKTTFFNMATSANMLEIQSSEMAPQRAKSGPKMRLPADDVWRLS